MFGSSHAEAWNRIKAGNGKDWDALGEVIAGCTFFTQGKKRPDFLGGRAGGVGSGEGGGGGCELADF